MDHSVPSWSDLLRDANILARKQRECYRDVHHLLENAIPELDRKIMSCSVKESHSECNQEPPQEFAGQQSKGNHFTSTPDVNKDIFRKTQPHPMLRTKSVTIEPKPSIMTSKIPQSRSRQCLLQHPRMQQDRSSIQNPKQDPPQSKLPQMEQPHAQKPRTGLPQIQKLHPHQPRIQKTQPQQSLVQQPKPQQINKKSINQTQEIKEQIYECVEQHEENSDINILKALDSIVTLDGSDSVKSNDAIKHYELDGLEHLKPLPMPLIEYFKLNRPHLMERANCRRSHLKMKSDRRKQNASTIFANQIAILRQNNRKNRTKTSTQIKIPPSKDYTFITNNNNVKYNFTEREIRQQTNRRYQSLPEVKKKADEEIKNHMKVQYYRNKLNYGRKLLQNRRQGIINYPIIATSDDVSLSSYQDEFSSGDYEINPQYNAFSMI